LYGDYPRDSNPEDSDSVIAVLYVGGYPKKGTDTDYLSSLLIFKALMRVASEQGKRKFRFAFAKHPGNWRGYDEFVMKDSSSHFKFVPPQFPLAEANAVSDITLSQESTAAGFSVSVEVPHVFLGPQSTASNIDLFELAGVVKRIGETNIIPDIATGGPPREHSPEDPASLYHPDLDDAFLPAGKAALEGILEKVSTPLTEECVENLLLQSRIPPGENSTERTVDVLLARESWTHMRTNS